MSKTLNEILESPPTQGSYNLDFDKLDMQKAQIKVLFLELVPPEATTHEPSLEAYVDGHNYARKRMIESIEAL